MYRILRVIEDRIWPTTAGYACGPGIDPHLPVASGGYRAAQSACLLRHRHVWGLALVSCRFVRRPMYSGATIHEPVDREPAIN
jgi:hypothetical protein